MKYRVDIAASLAFVFYRTERAVRTASSEQVRLPIFSAGLDQWRHFKSYLGPLEAALKGAAR